MALRVQGEVDHHDGVLHDADEQHDADDGDDVDGQPAQQQRQQRPHPAEGSVERMVTGWMVLSYSTPSTMYMVTTAAKISSSVFVSEAWKASAAP